jgi:ribonucleoside-triphosphate reductase
MLRYVKKRNGAVVPFDAEKIQAAIQKAVNAAAAEAGISAPDTSLAPELAAQVVKRLKSLYRGGIVGIEEIQEVVETILIENGLSEIAKRYIRYRAARTAIREAKSELMDAVAEIIRETNRDNANVPGSPAGKVLQISEATSARYYLDRVVPGEEAQAHLAGDIYIHDLPWYGKTANCLQIPLARLLAEGFSTRHGYIRPPKHLSVAVELAMIIAQANQNEMHGGQSFAFLDRDLAPYVARERENIRRETLEVLAAAGAAADPEKLEALVEARLDRAADQAMEGLVYNACSMHSRAGAQTPFLSVNFGTDATPEGRLVTEKLLLAYERGLGRGEQPVFPNLVFKVREGVNARPGDPNHDLYLLAQRVAAKRLFPAFAFQDASFNKPFAGKGLEIPYMGCRTRVVADVNGPAAVEGRGNLFFVTLNLPRLGIRSGGDLSRFWAELDRAADLAVKHLLNRYGVLKRLRVKDFPFLMGQKLYLGSENLGPEDPIEAAVRHGTLSVGFIGLAECLAALTGAHHGESEKARELGLEIVRRLRERCDRATREHGLNFTLLATPAEGLAGKFTAKDRERFGVLPGITDKEWYTNSFHVPVEFPISIWDKIEIEGPYHALCNAGHISYVELDASPVHNLQAFGMILEAMREADMGYGAVNFPLDVCRDCGYNGLVDRACPRCGSGNISRVRRITGYLSDVANFNDAKKAELAARRSHGRGVGLPVPEVPGGDLRLAGIVRDSVVDGPGVRLVIFAQGCPRRCPGCHNPETWDFAGGRVTHSEAVVEAMRRLAGKRLTGITLSGGEPFAQAAPLARIARAAKEMGLDVWAYTGYTYGELLELSDPAVGELLSLVDVLVDGPYVEAKKTYDLPFRGSANQRLLVLEGGKAVREM